jgi:hypothetical protein
MFHSSATFDMNSRTLGLRVSSLIFALFCVAHIARLTARAEITIGSHRFGPIPSFIAVIISGVLSIWLAKLAGPWRRETNEPDS